MADEVRRLIRVRTQKGAAFKRDGFGKKPQLSDSWRKPRGQHNKQREQKKAKGNLPKPGFGSPVAVRGMHPSGFFEVIVHTSDDLEGLDPKTQAIRIAAIVGNRKRAILQEKAISGGFKVLNAKVAAKKPVEKPEPAPAVEKEKEPAEKKVPAKKAKPAAGKKKEPQKKAPAKAEPEGKEPEKKTPVKAEEPAKVPKAEKEPKEKVSKQKKEPAAASKTKTAKAKAEPAKETQAAKTPSKKQVSKPAAKPKKKTSKGGEEE